MEATRGFYKMIHLFSGKITACRRESKGERLEARDWKHVQIRSPSGLHNQEVGGESGREAGPPGSWFKLS